VTEADAIRIANAFIQSRWGTPAELLGARPPSKKSIEWTVLYKTVLPGGAPDEMVDGPTVVLVDPRTSSARFILSM